MIVLLVLASLIPLSFISAGAWIVFGRIISQKSEDHLQTIVRDHAATVDLFLQERLMALDLVARSATRDQIVAPGELLRVFTNLNASYTNSFLDLGVIDRDGAHLAYEGPYDLLEQNYAGSSWFEHVAQEGTYISDVFLGARRVPHFIMAVRKDRPEGGFWILRATINSETFTSLVAQGRLGVTGDCFLLDRQGRFQTPPAGSGNVLDPSDVRMDALASGSEIETFGDRTADGRSIIRTVKWIKRGDWLLVAQQEKAEVRGPFRAAMAKGMGVFAAGVLIIALAAELSTRYLFRLIERTTMQKEKLNLQLLQATKLASLGELATGLAHEINNPLAIIATEQTNISDLLGMQKEMNAELEEMLDSVSMTKKQVMRCKEITQKMLQFGRQHTSAGAEIDPGPQLREIVKLMKPQARVNNIELCLELEGDRPRIYIDATELQQLVVNMITNAIGAISGGGAIVVSGYRESNRYVVAVEDTGPGVPAELREKIFEPFFTTKPVGKGTGLGLAVCYGIATKWRGKIGLEGGPGAGALFVMEFPVSEGAG
jgi:two-component system NtrC family sensor kinase